ncbi:hypothetical protein D3C73_1101560 [compost metagenome]
MFSSVNHLGSIDPNLILNSPSIFATSSITSINDCPLFKSFPYEAISIPTNTNSLTPLSTNFLASATILVKFLLLTLPLKYGIIQYEQKLLQPSSILILSLICNPFSNICS